MSAAVEIAGARVATGQSRSAEFRRGWRNLTAATLGIGLGVAAYTPVSSLFFNALEVEFGWTKAVAAGSLIAMPITALFLPVAGWLIDKFGVRLIAGLSSALAVASYFFLSRMSGGVTEFYLAIIALNVLGCATGPLAYTRLVAAQFNVNRGMALAVAQFGIAFLGVLMPQFIAEMIGDYGWRGGYLFFAAATATGAIIAQLLMQPVAGAVQQAEQHGATPRQAIASGPFWLLGFAILAISAAAFGPVAQFQAVMGDRGIGFRAATGFMSLLAVSIMVSRLIVGRLLDLPRPAMTAAGVMIVAAAGSAMLAAGSSDLMFVGVAIILLGVSVGAELDLLSYFCARLFGLRHYAAIYGLLSGFFYTGIALGGISFGIIRTSFGTYLPALMGSTAALIVAAALFLMLGRSRPVAPSPAGASNQFDA